MDGSLLLHFVSLISQFKKYALFRLCHKSKNWCSYFSMSLVIMNDLVYCGMTGKAIKIETKCYECVGKIVLVTVLLGSIILCLVPAPILFLLYIIL